MQKRGWRPACSRIRASLFYHFRIYCIVLYPSSLPVSKPMKVAYVPCRPRQPKELRVLVSTKDKVVGHPIIRSLLRGQHPKSTHHRRFKTNSPTPTHPSKTFSTTSSQTPSFLLSWTQRPQTHVKLSVPSSAVQPFVPRWQERSVPLRAP